jgi:hypothetical protein
MEHRRKPPARTARSRLNTDNLAKVADLCLPNIEALIEDGEITLGVIRPVGCVAIANDGHNALAMLKRRPGENLADLLLRLDSAIELAIEHEKFTDEINTPSPGSKRR